MIVGKICIRSEQEEHGIKESEGLEHTGVEARKRRTGMEINIFWSGLLVCGVEDRLLKAQGDL